MIVSYISPGHLSLRVYLKDVRKQTSDFLCALYFVFSVHTGACFILNGDVKYCFPGFIAFSVIENDIWDERPAILNTKHTTQRCFL